MNKLQLMDQIPPGTCFLFFLTAHKTVFLFFKWLPFKWLSKYLHSSLTFCLLSVWHLKYLLYGSLWKSLLTPVLIHLLYSTYDFSPIYPGRYWIKLSLKYVRKMPLKSFSAFCGLHEEFWLWKVRISLGDPASS